MTNNKVINERKSLYDKKDLLKRYNEISNIKYDYEKEIFIDSSKINFERLLKGAAKNAGKKNEIEGNYNYIFSVLEKNKSIYKRFHLKTEDSTIKEIYINEKLELKQYTEIFIDYRVLYGLLTSVYHWNNVEGGSHFKTKRVPIDFNPAALDYLNFFSIV